MGIKTADMVKGLPGKEITADVDWLGILDSFDPTQLEEKYLNECARRNSYDTCYRWDTPPRPIEERIRHSEWAVKDCIRIKEASIILKTYITRGASDEEDLEKVTGGWVCRSDAHDDAWYVCTGG